MEVLHVNRIVRRVDDTRFPGTSTTRGVELDGRPAATYRRIRVLADALQIGQYALPRDAVRQTAERAPMCRSVALVESLSLVFGARVLACGLERRMLAATRLGKTGQDGVVHRLRSRLPRPPRFLEVGEQERDRLVGRSLIAYSALKRAGDGIERVCDRVVVIHCIAFGT